MPIGVLPVAGITFAAGVSAISPAKKVGCLLAQRIVVFGHDHSHGVPFKTVIP